jgi:hypothetical protein
MDHAAHTDAIPKVHRSPTPEVIQDGVRLNGENRAPEQGDGRSARADLLDQRTRSDAELLRCHEHRLDHGERSRNGDYDRSLDCDALLQPTGGFRAFGFTTAAGEREAATRRCKREK